MKHSFIVLNRLMKLMKCTIMIKMKKSAVVLRRRKLVIRKLKNKSASNVRMKQRNRSRNSLKLKVPICIIECHYNQTFNVVLPQNKCFLVLHLEINLEILEPIVIIILIVDPIAMIHMTFYTLQTVKN